jgi:heme/copper-type cytochrome/quinol oxidase subunit 1
VLKNRFQQVVAVIGLGLVLWYLASYITTLGYPTPVFGWVAYAPLSHATVSSPGADLTAGEQTLVWIGAIAIWVGLSCLILKNRTDSIPE